MHGIRICIVISVRYQDLDNLITSILVEEGQGTQTEGARRTSPKQQRKLAAAADSALFTGAQTERMWLGVLV